MILNIFKFFGWLILASIHATRATKILRRLFGEIEKRRWRRKIENNYRQKPICLIKR